MSVTFFQTVQSFSQFIMNYILTGGGLVDQNTANIRGEICSSCFNNKASGDIRKVCSACSKVSSTVVNSFRSVIIKNNKTTSENSLLACGICGCDNKISVWIPNKALLGTADANAFPTFCWKKKVLQDQDV